MYAWLNTAFQFLHKFCILHNRCTSANCKPFLDTFWQQLQVASLVEFLDCSPRSTFIKHFVYYTSKTSLYLLWKCKCYSFLWDLTNLLSVGMAWRGRRDKETVGMNQYFTVVTLWCSSSQSVLPLTCWLQCSPWQTLRNKRLQLFLLLLSVI